METKRFFKADENFVCSNCKGEVEKLGYTSRDHCPNCLCSIHIDNFPGDRANDCHGLLKPIKVEVSSKKGYVIIYKCQKCGAIKRNISASDDDIDLIIKLTASEEL